MFRDFFDWLLSPKERGVPIAIDGIIFGYVHVTDETATHVNGKTAKIVWIPGRIINLVVEK